MNIVSNIVKNNTVNLANNVAFKRFLDKKPLGSDVVCFSKLEVDTDWKELVPKLNFSIKKDNYLGGGGEANVYKINDKYVLRLAYGEKFVKPQLFKQQPDIFEGRNFGQPVAIGQNGHISINKLVSGKPIHEINKYDAKTYMQNLRKYANFPDEVLEDFVENVAFLNSKGYRIDDSNAENFLYDEEKQKIGIIDICKKGSSSLDLFGPYSHFWVLNPLVNSHDYAEIYKELELPERKEMIDLILKLQDRIIPMCQKYDIPIDTEMKRSDYCMFDLPLFLAMLDKFDVKSEEGLITQMARVYAPHLLEDNPNWDYRN